MAHNNDPTFLAFADAVAFAGGKNHITIWNPEGSGYVIELERLIGYNLQLAAVTGVAVRMEAKWCTDPVGGTTITPKAYNPRVNAVVPAGLVVKTGCTVSNEDLLFAFGMNNDEVPATNANANGVHRIDVFTAVPDHRKGALHPGQGFTLKQVTTSVIGSWGWQLVFTQHPYVP